MQHTEQFTIITCQRLSRCQWLVIGFLFLVILVAGHDLAYSAHYSDIQQLSSEQLVNIIDNGSITRRIAFVALLIGGSFVMARARHVGPYSSALRNNVALACFVCFAFLSVLWSSDPELTFRRAFEYLIFCIGAAAAGRILGVCGVVWLGFLGSTGYLLVGLISELSLGTFHPFSVDYRFCGTLHPNHQAWNCILLLISGSALLPQMRRFSRIACLMGMTLGAVCLLLTKSRTSLLCGALALIFYWAGHLTSKQKLALVFITGGFLAAVLLAATLVPSGEVSQLDRMLLAGRDVDSYQDFSGRLPLWELAMEYVEARPLAGYGFNSFWTPDHIREVSSELNWSVPHSHNGFIELMLDLGSIGLALYLYQLAGAWRLLQNFYKATRDPLVRFYLALLIFYFACMFTEAIGFDVGLPAFCVLSMLWSQKLWFRKQFAPSPTTAIPAIKRAYAHQ